MATKKAPPPRPRRFFTFFLMLVIGALGIWNFRLHNENHRLIGMVREARRLAEKTPAPPALRVTNPQLAARIQDERDAVEALAQRLHEAGVPDVSGFKRAVQNQEQLVADLQGEMKRLMLSRPAVLDAKAQRAQLTEQIDSETRLIAQLKAKAQRLKTSRKKEQRAEVPTLMAQIEAENQVVRDLKDQRTSLLKSPRQPAAAAPETPEQKAEREALEQRLKNETDRLTSLRAELETARTAPVDDEARRVRQELDKHQATLRQLEAKAKAEQ